MQVSKFISIFIRLAKSPQLFASIQYFRHVTWSEGERRCYLHFFFFEACYLHFRVIGFNQISNHCCKYSTIVFFTFFLKSIQVGGSMVCGICIGKIMNICNCVSSIKLLSKSSYQQSLVFVRVDEFFVAWRLRSLIDRLRNLEACSISMKHRIFLGMV